MDGLRTQVPLVYFSVFAILVLLAITIIRQYLVFSANNPCDKSVCSNIVLQNAISDCVPELRKLEQPLHVLADLYNAALLCSCLSASLQEIIVWYVKLAERPMPVELFCSLYRMELLRHIPVQCFLGMFLIPVCILLAVATISRLKSPLLRRSERLWKLTACTATPEIASAATNKLIALELRRADVICAVQYSEHLLGLWDDERKVDRDKL